MTEHQVVIAGGGPTGLMLAGELALAGVDVVIVERRIDQHLEGTRARGIHSRVIEVLDQRGIADRFIAAGQTYPSVGFGGARLDISDFPSRHNYLLGLSQSNFEPLLVEWVAELGVPIMRGHEVTGFIQDDQRVTVDVSNGRCLQAQYLVGCDGGRSLVRKIAGIEFPGLEASVTYITAEVTMDEEPEFGMRPEGGGIGKGEDGVSIAVTIREEVPNPGEKPTLEELRDALLATYGTDFRLRNINWMSRFSDATRQAASYRCDRVLLAGDAAHIHPPQGGQGLGIGIQDAVNLGWKLAQVVNRTSPATLLDTYHAERHPIGARVLQNTRAQIVLSEPDGQHMALREIVDDLLKMDEPRKYMVGMLSGLDIHYDLGEGHPLLGRRMPDLDVQTADGPKRIVSLLHEARGILLNLSDDQRFDVTAWSDSVRLVEAAYEGLWELPVIGEVPTPSSLLIRPDGYVAWTGRGPDAGLIQSLTTWFGARDTRGSGRQASTATEAKSRNL